MGSILQYLECIHSWQGIEPLTRAVFMCHHPHGPHTPSGRLGFGGFAGCVGTECRTGNWERTGQMS